MPGTVNDFIQRFSGAGSIDDREASQYYDRFASTHANDREFDNDTMYQGATEYLGQLPDQQFAHAATSAFVQAPPDQRRSLFSSLLGALQGRGEDPRGIQQRLGLSNLNPDSIAPDDYARLASYARRNHPEAIRDHVREQPGLLKAMGNPILMGALGMVAAHMMRKRRPQFV